MTSSTKPHRQKVAFGIKARSIRYAEPEEILANEDQERELATILNGVNEGYDMKEE